MKIKNCNECDRKETCKSYFGGLGCKYKIRPAILALILVFAFGSVASAMTKDEEEVIDEVIEIEAEDIGIKTIETEVEEDEDVTSETENQIVDEDEALETEEEPSEPPVGMVEGYIQGTYFEPNTYDEETGEYNYFCDKCEYAHCVSVDDNGYIYEEWCIVCGNGTDTRITDEEFETMGVECNVEF